jgi:hypothetical protein
VEWLRPHHKYPARGILGPDLAQCLWSQFSLVEGLTSWCLASGQTMSPQRRQPRPLPVKRPETSARYRFSFRHFSISVGAIPFNFSSWWRGFEEEAELLLAGRVFFWKREYLETRLFLSGRGLVTALRLVGGQVHPPCRAAGPLPCLFNNAINLGVVDQKPIIGNISKRTLPSY